MIKKILIFIVALILCYAAACVGFYVYAENRCQHLRPPEITLIFEGVPLRPDHGLWIYTPLCDRILHDEIRFTGDPSREGDAYLYREKRVSALGDLFSLSRDEGTPDAMPVQVCVGSFTGRRLTLETAEGYVPDTFSRDGLTSELTVYRLENEPYAATDTGATNTVRYEKDDLTELWRGPGLDIPESVLDRNGRYALNVRLTYPGTPAAPMSGELDRFFLFDLRIEPTLETSANEVAQGDAFVVRLRDLLDDETPKIDAGSDAAGTPIWAMFTEVSPSVAEAIIAVAHNRAPGVYPVTVRVGERRWDLSYTVKAGRFERQDLTLDTSDPQITEANSAAAYRQYREKIPPLFPTGDAARYWEGVFTRPVDWEAKDRRISTSYGIFRYTNGGSEPRRHPALDIAAPEGTPVYAPNNGRVVMAEYLLNTGNTLVVEYGGGLKSYFFHLSDILVESGEQITKGDLVGHVGMTGNSTGPHLHFEVRVGSQSLDPMLLMNGQSAIFADTAPTGE